MNLKRAIGLILILSSGVLSWSNFIFTGAVVGVSSSVSWLVVLMFIAGIVLVLTSKKTSLDILISNKAIERSSDDARVRGNMQRYINEIRMIAADPVNRPQEIQGEFHVSPRGHNPLRVAWHYNSNEGKLYIDDLLYHTNNKDYVDRWNRKVARREVTKATYASSGYQKFGA